MSFENHKGALIDIDIIERTLLGIDYDQIIIYMNIK